MYNLTVDEAHTFFVGDGQWLVHNIECPPVKAYDVLKDEVEPGSQANHLNQNAAFKAVIPPGEGLSVGMEGDVLKLPGSQHWKFHVSLEAFWQPFRDAGTIPTNAQYGQALKTALTDAGFTAENASTIANLARDQRLLYKELLDEMLVPRVPRKYYLPPLPAK
jgi:hypothetical protein